MTYRAVAQIRTDGDLHARIAACVAVEGISSTPEQWVGEHAWDLAAQPGWGDDYAYALLTHQGDGDYLPGRDESVISDLKILAAVQKIAGIEPAPEPEPEPTPEVDAPVDGGDTGTVEAPASDEEESNG